MKNQIRHFTDLEAWKVNHEVVRSVYKITESFPSKERFGIIDQLRRAAASITANIAEGWGRFHYADRARFYIQARGSNYEVQNYLILAKDLGFLEQKKFNELMNLVDQGSRILNGLIRSVEERSNTSGTRK